MNRATPAPLRSSATTYLCYGLTFTSELELPELIEAASETGPGGADVAIRMGAVPADGLPDAQQLGPFVWLSRDQLWLHVPNVAHFLVSRGTSIVIDPEPGAHEDSVRVFLLGSVMAALLFQRGYLVLHGNAIRIGDQCLVCVGPSGAGKSTLAAGFTQRGYEILADDVVPVDGQCRALPGFPRVKLWQDTAGQLGIDTAPLRRIRPDLEKFHLPLHQRFANRSLPIRWVYVLSREHVSEIRLEPVRGMDRFQPLRENTYRVRLLEAMALKAEHLQLCSRLAGRIRLTRVTRPEHGFSLDPLVDRILADIAAHP